MTNSSEKHKLLLPLKAVKALPFNEGLSPLKDHMAKKDFYTPSSWRRDRKLL